MKKETKELIDWIKKQISLAGTIVTDVSQSCWQQDRDKAIKFLDSLPEIESHLCRGGYIQDKNGTPCCEGDKIRVTRSDGIFEVQGVLTWDNYWFSLRDEKNYCTHLLCPTYIYEKVEE